jgi:hypothetical protein
VEQPDPENLLEAAHELADGGGRHVQLIGGGDVTEMPSGRLKGAKRI